ncbi:MAG: carboxymuconolactone decarboxylase family protein [Promethearchaeota archaeon]
MNKIFRLKQPRIYPLEKEDWDEETIEAFRLWQEKFKSPISNVTKTVANHSKLRKRWAVFSNHVLHKNSLKIRDREFLILRIGWLNTAKYEWVHHLTIAKNIGITDDEIDKIMQGHNSPGLKPIESAILKAADELYSNSFINDDTWNVLKEQLNKKQLIDFLFTAGEYFLVCWYLNSAGVQLEEGYKDNGIPIPTERIIQKKIPSNFTRLKEPRIYPLEEESWNEETQKLVNRWNEISDNPLPNIHKTIINNFKLFKRWRPFSNHVLFKSTLSPREREILILRIGWLCQSIYEWSQHVATAKRMGFSDSDINKIKEGPDSGGLDHFESVLLRAVDELYLDSIIHDETWNSLSERYNKKQLLDLIFTIGQYHLVSIFLNNIGVEFDKGLEEFSLDIS